MGKVRTSGNRSSESGRMKLTAVARATAASPRRTRRRLHLSSVWKGVVTLDDCRIRLESSVAFSSCQAKRGYKGGKLLRAELARADVPASILDSLSKGRLGLTKQAFLALVDDFWLLAL